MYRFFPLIAVICVAGCVERLPITEAPVGVTAKFTGANGADVLAGERLAGRSALTFAGTETVTIRTRAAGDETARARCQVDADYFTADVITPTMLIVPDYGPRSSDIRVQCQFGAARGSRIISMTDTRDDDQRSQISLGTEGVGFRLVVPLTKTDLSRVYAYPDAIVRLK